MVKLALIPKYKDREKQRRASILAVTQIAAALMIFAILVISIILTPEHIEVLFQGIIGTGTMVGSYYLLRKGKLELSAWIVVVLGWLILTVDLAVISGIRGINVLGQVLIIIFSGLVINGRAALIITAISLAVNFGIFQMEVSGVFASPNPLPTGFARWSIQSIYLSLAALYIWRADSILKNALQEAESTADRFETLFEHTNDCVVVFNANWEVTQINPQVTELLGYSADELVGKKFLAEDYSLNPQELQLYQDQVQRIKDIPNFEHVLLRKDNSQVPVEISVTIVPDGSGSPRHIQCVLRDIRERKAFEAQLKHQALHDPLTNLPNRAFMQDRLQISDTKAGSREELVAILFIDLDDFKVVNDTHGHETGDQLLIQIGSRLKETLRTSDTIARIGGDEFIIILDNVPNKENVKNVANKILQVVSQPYQIEDRQIQITVSIGINYTERKNLDTKELIKTSDQAMYQVKQDGKNAYKFYEIEGEN